MALPAAIVIFDMDCLQSNVLLAYIPIRNINQRYMTSICIILITVIAYHSWQTDCFVLKQKQQNVNYTTLAA